MSNRSMYADVCMNACRCIYVYQCVCVCVWIRTATPLLVGVATVRAALLLDMERSLATASVANDMALAGALTETSRTFRLLIHNA